MKINKLPPLEFLMECFEITDEFESGLKWKERPSHHFKRDKDRSTFNARFAHKSVGRLRGPYYSSQLFRFETGKHQRIYNHRVIYALYNKNNDFQFLCVDHIDKNKVNNNPNNLRLVTILENSMNVKIAKNNKSGVTGVCRKKRDKKWRATICLNGTTIKLGLFTEKEEAIKARNYAEKQLSTFYFNGLTKEILIEKINELIKPTNLDLICQ